MRAKDISSIKKHLVIFDIDDTLFHTTAMIRVLKKDGTTLELTNQQFNNYVKEPDDKIDFDEFKNAEKFKRESKPIKPMIDKLKTILSNAKNSKIIMLTARSDFDNRDVFLNTFREYGIDMSRVHVHRAGNLEEPDTPAEKKAVIIRQYLDTNQYDHVAMYDDSIKNLQVFAKLKQEYTEVRFFPYLVDVDGNVTLIRESVTFKTKQEELDYICGLNSKIPLSQWTALIEEHWIENSKLLIESVDTEVLSTVKQLHKNYNSKRIIVGEKYIPIQINVFKNNLILYDVYNNSPPTHSAEFLTLIEKTNDTFFLKATNGTVYKYPDDIYGKVMNMNTILVDNEKMYRGLQLELALKFNKTLSDLQKRSVNEAETRTKAAKEINKTFKESGYKKLGSGAEATVWAKDDSSVIKIIMPEDRSSMDSAVRTFKKFYEFCIKNAEQSNLPRFVQVTKNGHVETFTAANREFTMIGMERLKPLKEGSFSQALIWMMSDLVTHGKRWTEAHKLMTKPSTWKHWDGPPTVKELVAKIKNLDDLTYAKFDVLYTLMLLLYKRGKLDKVGWDLHTENVMQRSDGTLVIVDPWFASEMKD